MKATSRKILKILNAWKRIIKKIEAYTSNSWINSITCFPVLKWLFNDFPRF